MLSFPYESKNDTPFAVGVGSALMDIILNESDDFLTQNEVIKGGMELVDASKADELLAQSSETPLLVPGGSAANTLIGMGRLSGKAAFIGCCGDDAKGKQYQNALESNGVTPIFSTVTSPTGQVLSIVTPDAQRSMLTYLGAAAEMSPEIFTKEIFGGADLVHIEGYLLFNEALIRKVLEAAKAAGIIVSLDLAAFTVIDANPTLVKELVKEYVDIVLANEDEAKAYTGFEDEHKAVAALAQDAMVAVVKIGARGSLVQYNGEVTVIAPYGEEKPKDTTGAGDLWASGFLYGLINGKSFAEAGRIAGMTGYEVCRVLGAHLSDATWSSIKSDI